MTTEQTFGDPVRPYKLVQNSDGKQAVMFTAKPFKNYVIRFGKVELKETVDEPEGGALLKMEYEYELLKGATPSKEPRKSEFLEYMGSVLRDLIFQGLREHTLPLSTDKDDADE